MAHATRSHKSWRVFWDAPRDPSQPNKRQQRSKSGFRTKKEAEAWGQEQERAARRGEYVDRSKLTVGEYFRQYWEAQKNAEVAPNSLRTLRTHVEKHIVPGLGEIELQRLTIKDVEQFVFGLSEAGLSENYRHAIYRTLRQALSRAVDEDLIVRNPATKVRVKTPKNKKPMTYWTQDELNRFLGFVREDHEYPLWLLLATTGMRRGEAAALQWADVNFSHGLVSVQASLDWRGDTYHLGSTKTLGSRRSIPIPQQTLDALESQRELQATERLKADDLWVETGFVFTQADGMPLKPDWITDRFRSLVRQSGLPHMGPHGLRHTHATLLLMSGKYGVHAVQERLGHSDVTMTLNKYAHVMPGMQRELADAVGDMLS